MKSFAFIFAVVFFVTSCSRSTATPGSSSAPTAAEAKKFLDEANDTTLKLGTEANKAGWVSENFITDDTSALNARANQRATDAGVRYAKEAVKFDHVQVDPTSRR